MVLGTASEAGIDIEKLQADMEDPEITKILERNHRLAQGLGIDGTPAFVIGETLIPGAADIPYLKDAIEKARESES
jgi:protein-disulfide isomerase